MAHVKLFEFLNRLIPSPESFALVAPLFDHKLLKKGDLVLEEGALCTGFYFVESGHLRTYYERDGIQINVQFHLEGDITSDYKNGKAGQPAEFSIAAGEKSEIWILDNKKLLELCRTNPEVVFFGKRLLIHMLMDYNSQSLVARIYSPRERYQYLQKNNPRLLQRVSLSNLASYLGMTRRTLTRIRAQK